MTLDFPAFARIVAASFRRLTTQNAPFITRVDGDALYEEYIKAFPAGTNPTFKVRTEHDCVCCKHFIRRVGNVVAINPDFHVSTIWDDAAKKAPHPYNLVAAALRDAVLSSPICGIFRVRSSEACFGAERTLSQDPLSQEARKWDHFFTGDIERALRVPSPGQVCGDYATTVAVFKRGLTELSSEAVESVLSLVTSNGLYRGEEHKPALVAFQKSQRAFLKLGEDERQTFAWAHAGDPAARFRNTVIGTLVQDLSDGVDLEVAVRSFEAKVAPQNYKRTTAIVTPAMVKQAMETIQALDLESALERRLATLADISVRDVLWVDGSAKPLMKGGIGDLLMAHARSASSENVDGQRADAITMDDFVTSVLPNATEMEVLFKNNHVGNLMVLTAPVHPEPKQLFRWNNDFGWSYGGNVADSLLRQKVQSLGGRVDGVLRFSHMWNHAKRNASLMDLHVFMPGSSHHSEGCHDNYPVGQRVGWNRRSDPTSGGVQDVDYTSPAPEGYVPVENITFPSFDKLKDGQYTFKIHNWSLRPPTQGGFRAEIEFGGQVFQYEHPAPLKQKEWVTLAVATLKNGVFSIEHKHPVGIPSQEKWGLTTEQFVKVNVVTLSPNFWGGSAVGNRHTFFVLDGCKADEELRGIYNEFLHPRLEGHRKVFEVIGDKTKCQPTGEHMAGLGFSSTKKDAFVIRVRSGKTQRTYNVKIG